MKRGGPQTTDMLTMTEFITRHDDMLSIVQVVDDPIYLDEPYVLSITYTYDPNAGPATENCSGSSFAENGGRDRHWVPHFLPGQNSGIGEFLKTQTWIPFEPVRGGVKTIYPEYRACHEQERARSTASPCRCRSRRTTWRSGSPIRARATGRSTCCRCRATSTCSSPTARTSPPRLAGTALPIVNTGSAQMTDKVLAALERAGQDGGQRAGDQHLLRRELPGHAELVEPVLQHRRRLAASGAADALHHQHQRGAGARRRQREARRVGDRFRRAGGAADSAARCATLGETATIVAHDGVLSAMSTPAGKTPAAPEGAWPVDTFFDDFHKLSEYVNGEPVILYHAKAANTDGDSFVFFRHSEVIAAGNLFSTISYPLIDTTKGGTIQGVIDGLNHILDLSVAEYRSQGGTWIVPGRGRLSDTADVASYRNMLVMIRDRIRELKKQGHDARAGEGGAPDAGLRRALRLDDRRLDDEHVHRGGVQDAVAWQKK